MAKVDVTSITYHPLNINSDGMEVRNIKGGIIMLFIDNKGIMTKN